MGSNPYARVCLAAMLPGHMGLGAAKPLVVNR